MRLTAFCLAADDSGWKTADSKHSESFNTGRHNPPLLHALSGGSKPAPNQFIFRTFLKPNPPNHPRKGRNCVDLLYKIFWSLFSLSVSLAVDTFAWSLPLGNLIELFQIEQSYLHEH